MYHVKHLAIGLTSADTRKGEGKSVGLVDNRMLAVLYSILDHEQGKYLTNKSIDVVVKPAVSCMYGYI